MSYFSHREKKPWLLAKILASSSLLLQNKVRVEKGSAQNRGLVTKECSVTNSVTYSYFLITNNNHDFLNFLI